MEELLQEGQIFLIDKPYGWTSFDVINKIRNHLKYTLGIRKIKIGHAGTLDPLATGLLVVCTGKFTKRIDEFQDLPKEYEGTFYFGKTTPSYDLEHEPDKEYPVSHITPELLFETAKGFVGELDQIPPVFSAIKVEGRRAYKFARKNQDLSLKARKIQISSFELTTIDLPLVGFRVKCSKGTYIRSLARDFGESVGSGAYLHQLRRTGIGDFTIQQAEGLDSLLERLGSRQ